jgi:hypothetical protein
MGKVSSFDGKRELAERGWKRKREEGKKIKTKKGD